MFLSGCIECEGDKSDLCGSGRIWDDAIDYVYLDSTVATGEALVRDIAVLLEDIGMGPDDTDIDLDDVADAKTYAWKTVTKRNEEQTITNSGTITSGSWRISFSGDATANMSYAADAATIDTALENEVDDISSGDVVVTGGPLPSAAITIEFQGLLGYQHVPQVTVNALTLAPSPSIAIATTLAGRPDRYAVHVAEEHWRTSACGGSATDNLFHGNDYDTSDPYFPFYGYARVPGGAP